MTLDTPISIVNLVCEIAISICAIVGNLLVLYVVKKNASLHTVTNYFIANLAVADLLVGACAIPFALVSEIWQLPANFYGCLFLNCMVVIFTQSSIFSLLAIAIERFAAVKNPFRYQKRWTPQFAVFVIAGTWILAFVIGTVPLLGWHEPQHQNMTCKFVTVMDMDYMVYFNFFATVLPPLLIMLGLYSYIFYIVHKHTRQIADLQISDAGEKNRRRAFKKEFSAAKSLAFIIGFFAFCWLPIHIMNTLSLLCGGSCDFPFEVLLTAILLSHANSAINPALYAYAHAGFRKAFRKVFNMETSSFGSYNDIPTITRKSHVNSELQNNSRSNSVTVIVNAVNGRCGLAGNSIDATMYDKPTKRHSTVSIKDNVLKEAVELRAISRETGQISSTNQEQALKDSISTQTIVQRNNLINSSEVRHKNTASIHSQKSLTDIGTAIIDHNDNISSNSLPENERSPAKNKQSNNHLKTDSYVKYNKDKSTVIVLESTIL